MTSRAWSTIGAVALAACALSGCAALPRRDVTNATEQRQQRIEAERLRSTETRAAFESLWRGIWPPPLQ